MNRSDVRLRKVEKALDVGQQEPAYLCISEAEWKASLNGESLPPGSHKVYVGICPDDWDWPKAQEGASHGSG